MLQVKLSDLIGIINKIAPPSFAEEWDNSGLQLGDPVARVERIMVALDPLPDVVAEAVRQSCQLLVTHHPLIFSPLKRVSSADQTGKLIYQAIRGGLGIASLHTNYDVAAGGVNDLLAAALGLESSKPLRITVKEELVKLVIFVPLSHEQALLDAILPFSGLPGNYGDCSFRSSGVGTFRPLEGAAPFIGTVGNREMVAESKIEVILNNSDLQPALKAMRTVHPYEEPAFDIVPLKNDGGVLGLGRIGELQASLAYDQFCALVKERLGLLTVRICGTKPPKVSRVALCGGSGASLLRDAARQGADVYVTGDVKYHDAREAEALGIFVIDAGHFATERLMVDGLCGQLRRELAGRNIGAEVIPCLVEKDPFANF
jgi:dinuclear metal center YbgI/SA1388 family protein